MSKYLLEKSPTGVEHYASVEDDGNTLIVEEFTPDSVEREILDDCARLRSLHQVKGRHFQFAARIPINTYYIWQKKWRTEGYIKTMTWSEFEVMMLNSSDNANLRVGFKRSGSKKL